MVAASSAALSRVTSTPRLASFFRSHCHADREHDRERHGYRAHEEHQHEGYHFDQRRAANQRQDDDDRDQCANDHEEPADDFRHHGLDVKLGAGLLDQLGCPSEIGLSPGQHDDAIALPRRTTDPEESTPPTAISTSLDSPVRAD